MVGGVEACRRVAAVALLAMSSVVPHDGPLTVTAHAVPVADTGTACAVTVGDATTDPALAADAARAVAAGYPTTDCMPDAALLAAAEARAALPLGGATAGDTSGGALVATSSGGGTPGAATGSVVAQPAPGPTVTTTDAPAVAPPSSTATATGTVTATPSSTAPTTSESSSSDAGTSDSSGSNSSGSDSSGSDSSGSDSSGSDSSGSDSGSSDSGSSNSGGSNSGGSNFGSSNSGSSDGEITDPTSTNPTITEPTSTDPTTTEPTSTTDVPDDTGADALGWGAPTRREEFTGGLSGWSVGGGSGSSTVRVAGGIATVPAGTTLTWDDHATSGRWQARLRVAVPGTRAALLLSPGPGRDDVEFALPVSDRRSADGTVTIDPTRWHDWAVEWSPTAITAYVDGHPWFRTTDAARFPKGPLDLALQVGRSGTGTGRMDVDWVRSYPPAGTASGAPTADTTTADTTTADTTTADTTTGGSTTTGSTTEPASVTGATVAGSAAPVLTTTPTGS